VLRALGIDLEVVSKDEARHVRALVAVSGIDGAEDLTRTQGLVPERQVGWYVDAAYDITDAILGPDSQVRVAPWVRFEDLDLQAELPAGETASGSAATQTLTVGVDVKPHPQVVLKAEYVHKTSDADVALSDDVLVGAGFIF